MTRLLHSRISPNPVRRVIPAAKRSPPFPTCGSAKRDRVFLDPSGESMGYCRRYVSAGLKRKVLSYNKRTMDWAMGLFGPLWHFTESITYVVSTSRIC